MQFETVASGFVLPEGPVAMADGSVLVCNMGPATLERVLPDGTRTIVAHTGGGPNGAAIGPDGAVYICNNGGGYSPRRVDGILHVTLSPESWTTGSIQRVDLATGAVNTLYTECDGVPLEGPNDLMFDRAGNLWFTDHGRPVPGARRLGGLFCARADGSRIACARRGLTSPNGIGLSPDEQTLYWADTVTGRVYAAAIVGFGEIAPAPGWSQGEVLHNVYADEGFDSLAMEADGRVAVARLPGSIRVVAPDGASEDIPVPDAMVTNICFGGADMRDAWITASWSGRLLKCRWPRPGLRLPFNA